MRNNTAVSENEIGMPPLGKISDSSCKFLRMQVPKNGTSPVQFNTAQLNSLPTQPSLVQYVIIPDALRVYIHSFIPAISIAPLRSRQEVGGYEQPPPQPL
jgi:hypothetical protein